ncbi:DEP domain-containing protein DDB_G0279099 isoform X1 [Apis laboriosa]|uniref:DEP domain-containing protein DDB_G0279099 isoform X1 n=1 Tax=Apis laboriosa TaxID=183418 RepID=UPI001CC49066|nr:DEP domain-containing protein DDB_G0279099 isoform X1 [Apis laboriosa]XP_043795666.1 DEP domain-containing protein DDB_G0279099 isoform X1 [Apis laboriosa]XP_043795667.1 DEP domain-containing protein DDB_G0279099 isoform X1 [Apis laboriosa]XP_043795669.1 DEP domain-containing protein DDB_G0279099 isoform X1 [Apis laboriosa]
MDATIERECSALGGLFQQIITDMKNGAPLWEDLISKATKLHSCLRAAILAISAYLETFQKIADAATNARGATKEIGTALTRICLRHKAVETRMKSFTSAIMDCLVLPLQEKLEDWKKSLINLDKEHAKEYKKAKAELRKRSTDTLRLQKKKARKGQHLQGQSQGYGTSSGDIELNRMLESSAAVVQEKRLSLEETERKAVRAALLEERGRYCLLARFLKPVLDEEIAMLMELTHLQEVSDQLQRHAASPHHLPPASEQVITDIKGCDVTQWSLATPPSSPSLSLGSRKSSMCSISSLTSSSSGSCKSHPSPSGHPWHRSLSQSVGVRPSSISSMMTLRHLVNGSSRDSGFTSQDTLYTQPISEHQVSNVSSQTNQNTGCTTTRPVTTATWPDLQETSVQYDRQNQNAINERPHTISSAYEKGHQRPALSVYTFQAPDNSGCCHSQPASPVSSSSSCSSSNQQASRVQLRRNNGSHRPPIPNRCSSLERPTVPVKNEPPGSPRGKPKLPLPAHLAKELATHQLQQPMYVNMHELANLAASRAQEMQLPLPPPPASLSASGIEKTEITEKDGGSQTSESSVESSSGYGSQTTIPHSHSLHNPSENAWNVSGVASTLTVRRGSMQQANKPLPPTRRTSTIITATFNNPSSGSNDERTDNTYDETENLPPPPAFLLESSSPTTSPTPQRSISVSETVRTLTELRHTPASPSLLRKVTGQAQSHNNSSATLPHNAVLQVTRSSVERSCAAIRSASQERSSNTTQITAINTGVNIQGQGPGGVGQSFMAVLSAKLINSAGNNATSGNNTNSSPKSTRKHSIEQQISKNSKTPSGFLETLNAKLAQQQQNLQGNNTTSRSASVRRIMGNRVPIMDPLQVRDSLMDQIRKGTSLRKTSGPINDRSAPKIY